MKSVLIMLVLACGLVTGLGAKAQKAFDYTAAWQEIERLQDDLLPQSMTAKVDAIYEAALRERAIDQQIKALVYHLAILQDEDEGSGALAINKLNERLQSSVFPASAILHSMLGELLQDFERENSWEIYQRSETLGYQSEDIDTWDIKTIRKAAIQHYQLSLHRAAELQAYPIADFPAFLYKGGAEERKLRPTLYDFLAYRALDYYCEDRNSLRLPVAEFSHQDLDIYQPAADFAQLKLSSPDSLSNRFQAVLLFQDLIRFHLKDSDPSALVALDLDRLDYVYGILSTEDPEARLEQALRAIMARYADHPASASAAFDLASLLCSLGDKYAPESSEAYRWHYQEAARICDTAVLQFPDSFGGKSCRYLADSIRKPSLDLSVESTLLPNSPAKALLSLKNTGKLELKLYRIPYPAVDKTGDDDRSWMRDDYKRLHELNATPALWSQSFSLKLEDDFRLHSYELPLPALSSGHYLLIAHQEKDRFLDPEAALIYSIFDCSELAYLYRSQESDSFLILNRRSGLPIHQAQISIYYDTWDRAIPRKTCQQVWSGETDLDGLVQMPPDSLRYNARIQISCGADSLQGAWYNHSSDRTESGDKIALLFTDRPIYRPGQNIFFKGILYETDDLKSHKLLADTSIEVKLYDASYQVVASQEFTSNEFGTFNGVFTAPQGLLGGYMYISTPYGRAEFSVEEYKRPRFEVTLDQPAGTYKLGQTVELKGRALSYAGIGIDKAQISYQITRRPQYPFWFWSWGSMPYSATRYITHGKAETDSRGEFSISFLALGDADVLSQYNPYFSFGISVDITDISGETQSGGLNLAIGERDLILTPEIAEQIDLNSGQLSIPIAATNLGGEPIAAQGVVTIKRLQNPLRMLKSRLWDAPDRDFLSSEEALRLFPNDILGTEDRMDTWPIAELVYTGSFSTPLAKALTINGFGKWISGAYVLELTSVHEQEMVKELRYFTVYDSGAKRVPYPQAFWMIPVKTTCEPGETAKLLIGSSYAGASLLYELERNSRIVHSERIVLSDSQFLLNIPVTEADRGSFYVHFTMFKDGRSYLRRQEITVPWTNKEIAFEYMSFRDKLLPGQKEEWRIKLKDSSGGSVDAEVLASMFDASLSVFRSGSWSPKIYGKLPWACGWIGGSAQLALSQGWQLRKQADRSPWRDFDYFDWFDFYTNDYGGGYSRGESRLLGGMAGGMDYYGTAQSGVINIGGELHIRGGRANEINFTVDGMSVSDPQVMQAMLVDMQDLAFIKARSNFAETAFFYPELRTDENGEISFVFTVPDALTRWDFRALALSKDFMIGSTTKSTITQKPLMVVPNAPRFLREGDDIVLSAKITALEGDSQSGTCQLFLFDAITMAAVDTEFGNLNAHQAFTVNKGESTVLEWNLSVPQGYGAIVCRVVAKAGEFSDGEEITLPVLSNRVLVTESLPLPVGGKSTRSFTFEKLKNNAETPSIRSHKLTLEFTSNPVWYAVQALPYLMEYPHDCSEQIFSRYFANSLASHIASSDPSIKRVFESWRDAPASSALLSKLELNQEFKSVLLQESPWLLDAKNETENKQRLGLLLDLNNMANQATSALNQLAQNQSPSGAWPWFPGLGDSRWVTQHIVEGFGQLRHLGVDSDSMDTRLSQMIPNAITYLDQKIVEDYQFIQSHGKPKQDNLSYMALHYLYARSFYTEIPIPSGSAKAVKYFLDQAQRFWNTKDIYEQGLIALILHRKAKPTVPAKIIASLKERALHSEELGMWWKQNKAGWFWYQAPIETQALLIEAFAEITDDTPAIDAMRLWLLKQKQTTNWKTTKATAAACSALLNSGSKWLAEGALAQIKIGGKPLDPSKLEESRLEVGTGYFKTSWSGTEITPPMAELTIANPNRAAAWGSLYWQYFEDLDRVTPAESPLRLKKALFVEKMTDSGPVIQPLKPDDSLKVGDKVIVRIELRSDRDMEYIHMKDLRAGGLEPLNVISGSKWQGGLLYYESTGDAATNFFIEYLPKGTHVFEYPLRVNNRGDFSNGITSIQCMYAPEFSAHSEGIRIQVK